MRRLLLVAIAVVTFAVPALAQQVGEVGVDWLGNDIIVEAIKDPEVEVRRQVAQELVKAGDRETMPTLIGMLAELKYSEAMEVEEQLLYLAGATAPAL